ncbi:MAG: hypothetical protein NDJ89_15270 [Oligoflexia bacterium]|nr:hypothetical protein [Oligoflexia bacterium]
MAKQPLSLLPLPELLLRHHGERSEGAPGLFGIMKEWIDQKKIPPVLLLTGIPGIGKRSIGHFLAQWILCESGPFAQAAAETGDLFGGLGLAESPAPSAARSPDTIRPCGSCGSCQRALKGSWIDFTEILPEEGEGEALKIDQFRELKSSQGFGAHEAAYRVILIPNSDRMTPQAANSILKLLEEPPAGWLFFLTASDSTLLLPTIVSRCQTLRLRPFRVPTLEALLTENGVAPARAVVCAALAHGSWGKALQLAQDEAWERRKSLFELLTHPAETIPGLVDWAASEPRNFELLLDQLEQLTADLIRWSATAIAPDSYAWANADGRSALIQHAKALTREPRESLTRARDFWLERAERLAQARQQSLAPLNRKLLIQDLLLPWLAVR